MADISICVEMVYDDEPFAERIERAADVGADAVEFWDWREKDLETVVETADAADVPIAGFVAGGTLTDPTRLMTPSRRSASPSTPPPNTTCRR